MRLPYIDFKIRRETRGTSTFLGLNQQILAKDGEFADMKNISDRFFPCSASRQTRGSVQQTLKKPKALAYKNGLFYIDGTEAFYKESKKFDVSDTPKTVVGMGAYLCVFPDGILYNTNDGSIDHIVAEYKQTSAITFAPLSAKSAYTKITATGIEKTFKKGDAVTISGCTNDNYNSTKIITDIGTNYIVVTGALDKDFSQASGLTFKRMMPEMDFIIERDNRLWGCSSKNHEIYCCKIGDPRNWHNYEGGADSAYAATVGSDGDFTGVAKIANYILFMKENTVHILRGDKPANFSLTEADFHGIKRGCDRSVQNIEGTLYYVGVDGVYAYNGAFPNKISGNITEAITEAVASQYKGRYYLSCKLNGNRRLLVYNPKTNVWVKEDNTVFKYAEEHDNTMTYISGLNELRDIYGGSEEVIEWSLESADIHEDILNEKYVAKIKVNLWLAIGSEVNVFIKTDDEPMWHKKGYIRSTKNKTYTIPIIPTRCSKYRIKLEGRGQFKLLALAREIEQGSDMNGSLQWQYRR